MTEKKQSKNDFIRYILVTPIDEIIEGDTTEFIGETETIRASSIAGFTRIRGIIQKGNQIFTGDDNDALVKILKQYIKQKNPSSE
jgi:hypothetical protein